MRCDLKVMPGCFAMGGVRELRQFWLPRFHHDAGIRWLRNFFAEHFVRSPGEAVEEGGPVEIDER